MKAKEMITALVMLIPMSTAATELKVMSYNIRNCKGMDKEIVYARVSEVITAECPAIVMLQEVDSCTRRSSGVVVCDTLASLCGMHATYAPAIDFDGGKYGIALLTQEKPISVKRYALPGREENRALLITEFKEYAVASTHLSLTEADRNASLPIIIEAAKQYKKPFIIAGDFNAEPNEEFIKNFSRHFTIVGDLVTNTFPADEPNIKIDYIAILNNKAGKKVKWSDYRVIDEPMASDHRPIVAKLKY